MQLLLLSALAFTATVANAQLAGISNCTIGCVNNFCPDFLTTLNLTCLCSDQTEEIGNCIETSCTSADLTAAEGLEAQYCMFPILSKTEMLIFACRYSSY